MNLAKVMIRVDVGRQILVWTPFTPTNRDRSRSIPGALWLAERQCWAYPYSPASARAIVVAWQDHGDLTYPDLFWKLLGVPDTQEQAQAVKVDRLAWADLPDVPSKTATWAHQKAAYWFARTLPAVLLHVGLGAGKSKITVDLICNDTENHDGARLPYLILAPRAVVPQWVDQFKLHGVREDANAVALATDGRTSVAEKTKNCAALVAQAKKSERPLVLIMNYETARLDPMRTWLLAQRWRYVVADEIQKIKDPTGTTGQFAAKLGKQAEHRLGLTGTPMPHSPLDVFSQFRFLDSSVFGTSWTRFRKHYAVWGGYGEHEVRGYINQDELASKMAPLTFQAGREVLDLPDARHMTRECDLSPEARRHYRDLEREMITWLDEQREAGTAVTAANAAVKVMRLQQCTSGFLRNENGVNVEVDRGKTQLLADLLEEVEPKEPVVVFCRFQHDLDMIRLAAREAGRESYELSGRRHELADWQRATDGSVIAVQIQAGGVGISMVRACICVYYSVGWSLGDYEQSLARVHRPGQGRPVSYYHLLVRGTVDHVIEAALRERKNLVEAVLAAVGRPQKLAPESETESIALLHFA